MEREEEIMPDATPEPTEGASAQSPFGYVRSLLTEVFEKSGPVLQSEACPEDLRVSLMETRAFLRTCYGADYDLPNCLDSKVSGAAFFPPLYLRAADYPQATGLPGPGYRFTMPLDDGRTLNVDCGEIARANMLNVMAIERRAQGLKEEPELTPASAIALLSACVVSLLAKPGDIGAKEDAENTLRVTQGARIEALAELSQEAGEAAVVFVMKPAEGGS